MILSHAEARAYLLTQTQLMSPRFAATPRGVRKLLDKLRCIQLDPLDVLGTNADLVAMARVDGLAQGAVYRHLLPGHAFEHFAKERCLLPASAFPYYRTQAAETPWWRLGTRLERLPEGVLERVRAEVEAHGPLCAADLAHHGSVAPIDWSGWKGTARAGAMALEVLWTRCEIVVCGRSARGKLYDVPERALPKQHGAPASGEFARWAIRERVEAAGLLSRASGPWWSMLSTARTSGIVEQMLAAGELEEVGVEGSGAKRWLAPAGFRRRALGRMDERMRILGPLDPLLWDRRLVREVFGFEYVWEVYKPAALRRFGWYVVPLLHRGALIGRLEGKLDCDVLHATKLWKEKGVRPDDDALDEALARHAAACGASRVKRPKRWLRG